MKHLVVQGPVWMSNTDSMKQLIPGSFVIHNKQARSDL